MEDGNILRNVTFKFVYEEVGVVYATIQCVGTKARLMKKKNLVIKLPTKDVNISDTGFIIMRLTFFKVWVVFWTAKSTVSN